MMVLITENAPPRLRGKLTLWMVEVRAGAYVTHCSAKLREWIWRMVSENIGDGNAVMIWSTTQSEFGYRMLMIGDNSRFVTQMDNVQLISLYPR